LANSWQWYGGYLKAAGKASQQKNFMGLHQVLFKGLCGGNIGDSKNKFPFAYERLVKINLHHISRGLGSRIFLCFDGQRGIGQQHGIELRLERLSSHR